MFLIKEYKRILCLSQKNGKKMPGIAENVSLPESECWFYNIGSHHLQTCGLYQVLSISTYDWGGHGCTINSCGLYQYCKLVVCIKSRILIEHPMIYTSSYRDELVSNIRTVDLWLISIPTNILICWGAIPYLVNRLYYVMYY